MCEYLGARFEPPYGMPVQEAQGSDTGEPFSRVTMTGKIGAHTVFIGISPRAIAKGEPTVAAQTDLFFAEAAATSFGGASNVTGKSALVVSGKSLPTISARQSGSLATTEFLSVLYFPDDLSRDRYFYAFLWSDGHATADPPLPLTEFQRFVASFAPRATPVGAPPGKCTSP